MNAIDFIARLTYLAPSAGGRTIPATSGYRPHIRFPFSDMQTSGRQIFTGRDSVNPGETVEAEITIVATEYFAGRLYEGLGFEFLEGATLIGTGTILKIVNQSLKKHDSL